MQGSSYLYILMASAALRALSTASAGERLVVITCLQTISCLFCIFVLFFSFVFEPDAALLVEDDEADCGNIIGGGIGWTWLLRTHLVLGAF